MKDIFLIGWMSWAAVALTNIEVASDEMVINPVSLIQWLTWLF